MSNYTSLLSYKLYLQTLALRLDSAGGDFPINEFLLSPIPIPVSEGPGLGPQAIPGS